MGEWVKRESMPTPKHDFQAVGVGAEIYAVTGSHDLTIDTVDVYETANNRWRPGPPIPTRRGYIGAAMLDKRIYVVGGKRIRSPAEKAESGDDTNFITHADLEALDLKTQTWSRLASSPSPRAGLTAAACRGRIYAIAGVHMDRGGEPFGQVWIFDPASGRWESGPPLPMAVWGPAAATVDDVILVAGGGDGRLWDNLYALDPESESWTSLAPMPTPRSDLSLVARDRRIYAIGGKAEPSAEEAWGCTGCVEVYDIDSDTWSTEASIPMRSAWLATAVAQGRLFAMGGARAKTADSTSQWTSAEYLDDVYELID